MQRIPPYLFALFILLTLPPCAFAAAPDFYLILSECSTTIASSVQSDFPLKTLPGETSRIACSRAGKKATCAFAFEKGNKSIKGADVHTYDIVFEAGSRFDLQLPPTGGDYILIDRSKNSAIVITRVLGESYAGAKVCRGIFLTADEVEAINKNSGKP